jgi:hypothetical protein
VILTIDPVRTPALWGSKDLNPALEIYPNDAFDTSDGKTVLPGSLELGDFRHRVIGTVENDELNFPAITGIYSTEDSLTNQRATYSAYIRIKNRAPIPWLENFPIPVLTQGLESLSWTRIKLHAHAVKALASDQVYTKQQTEALINATLLSHIGNVLRAGQTTMENGLAIVATPHVRVSSLIFPSSLDPGVTGALRCEQADIADGEEFVIRSTNEGDNGAVSWMILN